MSSLPYHEPSITQILVLSSFLLALNAADAVLDRTLYCGLVGQVLVGVAWGAPGAGWLGSEVQAAVVQIGYLGLVLVVFEGGAATPVAGLRRDLPLSAGVALTGVAAPVALTFAVLGALTQATGVQCFAAAAALCSTSLGTTFAVLGASGLADTRLGGVLGAAAMMDDVVGLVMVQIVASLGGDGGGDVDIDVANAVVRPVLVSVAFAVAVPLACRFVLRPLIASVKRREAAAVATSGGKTQTQAGETDSESEKPWWQRLGFLDATHVAFVAQTALLIALVVGASYAGASVLLAAYLAGIVVSWWRDLQQHDAGTATESRSLENSSTVVFSHGVQTDKSKDESTTVDQGSGSNSDSNPQTAAHLKEQQRQRSVHPTPDVYGIFYSEAVTRILKPFFFASIGFSIPISDMFSGDVAWRGIVYSVLMAIGKMLCGLWFVRFPVSMSGLAGNFSLFVASRYHALFSRFRRLRKSGTSQQAPRGEAVELVQQPEPTTTSQATRTADTSPTNERLRVPSQEEQQQRQEASRSANDNQPPTFTTPAKPLSLYPAAIVSSAMVARGEIGFLISAVAESNVVFRRPEEDAAAASRLFLIVTWAIVLCTVAGPVSVGLLVRRVRKLESRSARRSAAPDRDRATRDDVLGAWGVHSGEVVHLQPSN
ncbi:Sodium/hydrogen exchanger [Hypoxylon rubiginosum]|uniref:Sodium/hydrogen exchanger n=1 Tax=Hypoxylon rubiginosum TaxID=110542 RepID=A0ACB9ZI31_9PEZI|nr:Sodium/hydrogen exchanger [Hypoxylon rubiginosum]